MEYEPRTQEASSSIWIIGNSVLMDGVEACLKELRLKNLVRWNTINTDLDAYLKRRRPNVIIFELDTPGSYILLDLLKEQPGIHLLGIDLGCNQVLVMNSFQRHTRTMTDLYQIVTEFSTRVE
jgi:hypothetical protein